MKTALADTEKLL